MKTFLIFLLAMLTLQAQDTGPSNLRTYNTIADMLANASPLSSARAVQVLGYHRADDGGGGMFTPTSDITSTNRGFRFVSYLTPTMGFDREAEPGPVSVRWFGTKADNSDDTLALQDAINVVSARGGGQVLLSPETYRHAGLIARPGVTLVGSSMSVLQYTGNGIALQQTGTTPLTDWGMRDLVWRGTDGQGGTGILLDGFQFAHLQNVRIERFRGAAGSLGLRIWDTIGLSVFNSFIDVTIAGCGIGLVVNSAEGGPGTKQNYFSNLEILQEGITEQGVILQGSLNLFDGLHIRGMVTATGDYLHVGGTGNIINGYSVDQAGSGKVLVWETPLALRNTVNFLGGFDITKYQYDPTSAGNTVGNIGTFTYAPGRPFVFKQDGSPTELDLLSGGNGSVVLAMGNDTAGTKAWQVIMQAATANPKLSISSSLGEMFSIAKTSGYSGSGANLFTDDGTYKSPTLLGLINPTDGKVPYRTSATTFSDSPLRVDVNSTMLFENSINAAVDPTFIINSLGLSGTNATLLFRGNDAAGARTMGGLSFQKTGPWGIADGAGRDASFSLNLLVNNNYVTRLMIESDPGLLSFFDPSGVRKFTVQNNSGYTGTGANFLADDGTYKVPSAIKINPTDFVLPMRSNATTLADSPLRKVDGDTLRMEGASSPVFVQRGIAANGGNTTLRSEMTDSTGAVKTAGELSFFKNGLWTATNHSAGFVLMLNNNVGGTIERLNISDNPSLSFVLWNSQGEQIAFAVADDSGWAGGVGGKLFTDNGTFKTPTQLGLVPTNITLNPTVNTIPMKSGATSFADSPLVRSGNGRIDLVGQPDAIFNMKAVAGGSLIQYQNTATDQQGEQTLSVMESGKQGGWNVGTPNERNGYWKLNVLHRNALAQRMFLNGDNGDFSIYDTAGARNFVVLGASGFTSTGTNFFADNGTFKSANQMGITNLIPNQTIGFLPYKFDATTFRDSPVRRVDSQNVNIEGPVDLNLTLSQTDTTGPGQAAYRAAFRDGTGSEVAGEMDFVRGTWSGSGNRWADFHLRLISGETGLIDRLVITDDPAGNALSTRIYNVFGGVSFTLQNSSGYASGGTKVLTDDGTYKLPATLGLNPLTINPTSTMIPYRLNATTFADSLFQVGSSREMRLVTPVSETQFPIFAIRSLETNNALGVLYFDFSDSDGLARPVGVIGAKSGTGWGKGTPGARDGAFSVQVMTDGSMSDRFKIDGDGGNIHSRTTGGVTNFAIMNNSGFTHAGTKIFTDDGTYKFPAALGVTNIAINPSDARMPVRIGPTAFGDSPFYTVNSYQAYLMTASTDPNVPVFAIRSLNPAVAADSLNFDLSDSGGATTAGRVQTYKKGTWDGTGPLRDAVMVLQVMNDGVLQNRLALDGDTGLFAVYNKTASSTIFNVQNNSGYSGLGNQLLSDDGLYKPMSSLLRINPTDGFVPYRIDNKTFGDSLLRFSPTYPNVQYMETTAGNMSLYMRSTYPLATASLIVSELSDADGAANAGYIMYSKSTGWGAGTPASRNSQFSVTVQSDNATPTRFAIDGGTGNINFYNKAGGLIFAINNASQMAGLGYKFFADDGTFKTLAGDLSFTAPSIATLATVNGNVGTFGDASNVPRITVDAKGRITGITTQPVSGGATGEANTGMNTGPAAGPTGAFGVFARKTGVTLEFNSLIAGVGVTLVSNANGTIGISSTAGGGTVVGPLSGDVSTPNSSSGVTTLATTGVGAGSYGNASIIPAITVDAKGRITAAAGAPINAITGPLVGDITTPNPTSPTTTLRDLPGMVVGTYGSGTAVPVITTDTKGRITAISTTGTLMGPLSGDVSTVGASGQAVTLNNSGVAAGTYGSTTFIPVVTVDAKGRVTVASSVQSASGSINNGVGILPFKSGANAFSDSPLRRVSANEVALEAPLDIVFSLKQTGDTGNFGQSAYRAEFRDTSGVSIGGELYFNKQADWSPTARNAEFGLRLANKGNVIDRMLINQATGADWSFYLFGSAGQSALTVADNSGWTGEGAKIFTDDGTFKTIASLGLTPLINPTDFYLPLRGGPLSMVNSPLYSSVASTVELRATASPKFVIAETTTNGVGYGTFQYREADSLGTAMVAEIAAGKQAGWGTASPSARDGFLQFYTLHDNVSQMRLYLNGDSGQTTFYDRVGAINFNIQNASGYGGLGANLFTDDGTYKSVSTLGLINPSENYIPFRSGARFLDSPFQVLSSREINFNSASATFPLLSIRSLNATADVAALGFDLTDAQGTASASRIIAKQQSGWGVGNPAGRQGLTIIQTMADNTLRDRVFINGADGSVTFMNRNTSGTTFSVINNSGYTGAGTKVLFDDGSYKPAATGTLIGPLSGDVSTVGSAGTVTTLGNTGVGAGIYGSSTTVPVLQVDAKGRITSGFSAAIDVGTVKGPLVGDITTPNPTSGTTTLRDIAGLAAGTYGDTNKIPRITLDTKGRVIAAVEVPSAAIVGPLQGDVLTSGASSPNTFLATVNANAGTWGDANTIPRLTVDGKGRVTAIQSVPVDPTGLVPTSRAINTTAPLTGGGPLTSSLTLGIPASASGIDGYLKGLDWNTFYGRVSDATNLGGQVALYVGKGANPAGGSALAFKTLAQGNGIKLTANADNTVTIEATGSAGEANSGANLGTGVGVYASKSGTVLNFRSITAGSGSGLAFADLGNNMVTATAPGLVPTTRTITANSTFGSIQGGGPLSGNLTLTLLGDQVTPAPSRYYGTDSDGFRGFFALPATGIVGPLTGDITTPVAGSPATTLKNTGPGAGTYGDATRIPVISLDAKGRVTAVTPTQITRYIVLALSDPNVPVSVPKVNFFSLPAGITITGVQGKLRVGGTGTTTLTLKNGVLPVSTATLTGSTTISVPGTTLTNTSVAADGQVIGEITQAGAGAYGAQFTISYIMQ